MPRAPSQQLKRNLGIGGATMMGLGSMVGTGVFVSIGVAAGVAGPAVILAIALAALIATSIALSSAQLAATHAGAGGTSELGLTRYPYHLGCTLGGECRCATTRLGVSAEGN